MWYVVNYWDHDPDVGAFLNQRKFDRLSEALVFARRHGTWASCPSQFREYYLDEGDNIEFFDMSWKPLTNLDALIEQENEP